MFDRRAEEERGEGRMGRGEKAERGSLESNILSPFSRLFVCLKCAQKRSLIRESRHVCQLYVPSFTSDSPPSPRPPDLHVRPH